MRRYARNLLAAVAVATASNLLCVGSYSNGVFAANPSATPCSHELKGDELAFCYQTHGISSVDIRWLRRLAASGDSNAEITLAELYSAGTIAVSKPSYMSNWFEAVYWFRKAAKNGNIDAKSGLQVTEFLIGSEYLRPTNGVGPRDVAKGLRWMTRAAEDGYGVAAANLAIIYTNGDAGLGIAKDYRKADEMDELGEEIEPNAGSESWLGDAYYSGTGVKRSYSTALGWYEKAAARGNADSEHNLGIMYMKGQGVTVNPGAAADWFYQAGIAYLKQGDRDDALLEAELIKDLQAEYGDLLPNGFLGKQLIGQIYAPTATTRTTPAAQPQTYEGTGWPVAGGFVVTNHHVIAGAMKILIYTANGTKMSATVAADDPNNDLVLLKVHNPEALPPALPLASDPAAVGEAVFALGYPQPDVMGADLKLTAGVISASSGAHDDPRFYQTSAQIEDGNSGSPLMNMQGQVIGIMTESLDAAKLLKATGDMPQNVNYAIKVVYLKALLQSAHAVDKIRVLPMGFASLENLDKRIAPSVVMVFAESSGGQ